MQIKLNKDYQDYKAGTIIDCDELTAKEILEGEIGEVYTQVEQEQTEPVTEEPKEEEVKAIVDEIVKKEIVKMEMEKKDGVVEVTKHAYSETQGWKSSAEFLMAVKKADTGRGFDPRLEVKAATGIGEFSGDGTNLVTPAFMSDVIYKQMMQDATLLPKLNEYKLAEGASATTLIKQVNETYRNNTSTFGGLRVYKVDEGSAITPSIPGFTQKSVTLNKAAVATYISDEAIRDVVGIVDQTAGMVGQAFQWQVENDIVNGGLSIATPIVGDGSVVTSTVAGAYPTQKEVLAMYNSILPGYNKGAEWFMSADCYANIMALESTGGFPVFSKDMKEDNDGLLLGKKINVVEWAGAINTASQIMFLNPSAYTLVSKEGMQSAASIHVAFLSDQSVFRWTYRFNGCPLYKSKITLPNGKAYSWAVTATAK